MLTKVLFHHFFISILHTRPARTLAATKTKVDGAKKSKAPAAGGGVTNLGPRNGEHGCNCLPLNQLWDISLRALCRPV